MKMQMLTTTDRAKPVPRQALLFLIACGLALGPGVLTHAQNKRPVSFDDIMSMKTPGSPAISPDGAWVVYTVRQWETPQERDADSGARRESRTHLWRVRTNGEGAAAQFTFSDRSETAPAWSPDGHSIAFLSTRASGGAAGQPEEQPKQQVWMIPAAGGESWKLTDAPESITAYAWSPDSKRIAYVMRDALSKEDEAKRKRRDDPEIFEGDFRHSHLWVMDLETKKAARVTEGRGFTVGGMPSWSPDGARVAFSGTVTPMTRDGRADVYVATLAGNSVEKVSGDAGAERAPVWSPDGKTIAWIATPNAQRVTPDGTYPAPIAHGRIMVYDVSSRRSREVAAFDGSPDDLTWSPDSARIYFGAGRRVSREVFALDVAAGKVTQLTRGQTISFGNISRDGSRVAFTKDSPNEPLEIFVADSAFTAPRRLTTTNPQAAAFELGESEVLTWKVDGFEIEGVLLKPVGYQKGTRYPLLTVVHGGPAGAHMNTYRVTTGDGGQAWAAEGWAVLYPNPRGSTNYGEKFMRANLNDWGGGDYRDIMAGVDAVIARGVADPDRLAVLGWSYGGYMTCWIVSQTTRFKAAMVGAGLTNMVSMHGTNDIPNTTWAYFGGPPSKQTQALFTARSGITYADNVTTPTLILHGSNDQRVPIGQPMEFYRALKDRGKTVELVFYPREGHGLTEYYHQLDRLKRQRDWIVKYTLGGGGRKTTTQ
jgi:dipeptidyl aminopeptidase/acylaminoacyl peptidase